MSNYLSSISFIGAILLSGCAIGPDYVQPKMDLQFKEQANIKTSDTISSTWWNSFGDEKLSQDVNEAIKNNFDLAIAQASVNALLGQFDQAQSYLYPQINGGTSFDRKGTYNAAASPNSYVRQGINSTYAASLSLATYELDLFGKVRRLNESARALLLSSEYAKETLKISISASVVASYFKISSLDQQILLSKENVQISKEIFDLTQAKYKYGAVSETVLLQAESGLNNAKSVLSDLQALKSNEESTYNILLGRGPKSISVSSIDTIHLPSVPQSLMSDVLKRRPDIAMEEQNLISTNAQIGVAQANYYPSIKLTGMLGVQTNDLKNFLTNPTRIWDITPSLTVPVFTAGRVDGEVRTAKAQYNQELAKYKKTVISAFNEVDTVLTQNSYLTERYNYQNKSARALNKAFEQARLQYKVGQIDYSTMLQIQQQWLQARQSEIISKQNLLTSFVSIYKVLGGGWS